MDQDVRADEEVDVEPYEDAPAYSSSQGLDDGVQDDHEDAEPIEASDVKDDTTGQELSPKDETPPPAKKTTSKKGKDADA